MPKYDTRSGAACEPPNTSRHIEDAYEAVERAAAQAAAAAAEVDRNARFPHEAVTSLREGRLLNAAAPTHLGGLGLTIEQLVDVGGRIARSCGTSAMIWAMHQVQLACVARHHPDAPLLARILAEQWLIASVTSEVGIGGDLRSSRASVNSADNGVHTLEKQASTVSYGADAQAFLVTARRDADAAPSSQVAVLVGREQVALEQTGQWNTLGMRGTCSPPFSLTMRFSPGQILPVPFGQIAASTMVPMSHVLWAAVWAGMADEALDRAARAARRRSAPGDDVSDLAVAHARLAGVRAQLDAAVHVVKPVLEGTAEPTLALTVQLNALKISMSETVVDVVRLALAVCGMVGFSEDGPYSVARILRDAFSAPLMIGNGRLITSNSQMLLLRGGIR
ncbi:acyl-CoA dehydrogenase family protein [Streptomyces sp. NPDC005402]|uniref:acyl-CoA dehydrogenase family protein n=1 Tax=Streptomyces sp. NPDC005402 TaxID=3155338 RepID=UPI0033A79F79